MSEKPLNCEILGSVEALSQSGTGEKSSSTTMCKGQWPMMRVITNSTLADRSKFFGCGSEAPGLGFNAVEIRHPVVMLIANYG